MKKINTFAALLLMAAAAMFSTSCENDNINPYDYVNNGGNGSDGNENQGSENTFTTKVAEYPAGSVVFYQFLLIRKIGDCLWLYLVALIVE